MIELERHIEILLLSNDCVIVPGFGGFVAHHVDARYSEDDGLFLPPLRTIGFNPQLKLNDSLLAQSYIEAYDTSYSEAIKRIDDDVHTLREHLMKEGSYTLNDIGTLSINSEGNYEFEPCEAGLLTPSLYALNSFRFLPLKQEEVTAVQPATVSESAGAPAALAPSTTKESAAPADGLSLEDDEEEGRFIKIPVNWIRNIAAACIAVIVFFLMPKPLADDSTSVSESKIDVALLYSMMPKNVTVHEPEELKADNDNTAEKPTAEMKGEAKSEMKAGAKGEMKSGAKNEVKAADISTYVNTSKQQQKEESFYTIVLASKVPLQSAKAFVESLHKRGLTDADIIVKPHNNKVIYGRYATMEEANSMKNKLNNDIEFADSWTTRINNAKH